MNGIGAKGWNTDREVFGAFRIGRAVADPFATARDHRLAGVNIEHSLLRFHP